VSEVDVNGHLLGSFTDVDEPRHLSVADDDNVLVTDYGNDRVLLLDSQLQLQRIIIDNNHSQLMLCWPERLCYSPDTSLLRVVLSPDLISLFRLR